jgi:hypothetical protein
MEDRTMTLDEQDKITEMAARLHASAVVLDEYDRGTKEHGGALWLMWDVIEALEGFIRAWDEEKAAQKLKIASSA